MKENKLKCTDLRIGNWVKVNDPIFGVNTYKVATIRDNGIITLSDNISCLVGNIEPIELTEELLVKIGFVKCDARYVDIYKIEKWIDEFNFISIDYRDLRTGNTTLNITHTNDENYNQCTLLKNNIKYLHQLQNAYYCLTGQELNIEL